MPRTRDGGLTPKQQRFVEEYVVDLNATQAAIRAGYSKRTAEWIGPQLLGKSHVAAAIAERRTALTAKADLTAERILLELRRLALSDPRKLFGSDGTPMDVTQLDDDTAAAIAGIDVVSVGNAELGRGQVLKIRLAPKQPALDTLAKYLGLLEERLRIDMAVPVHVYLPSNARENRG